MKSFTTLLTHISSFFLILCLSACSSEPEEEMMIAPSSDVKVKSLKLSVDGAIFEVDPNPFRTAGTNAFLRTKTPIPYNTEEVVIEEISVHPNASTDLSKGATKSVSPDVGFDFTVTAENGLEILYTVIPLFDFPDFTVETFDVVPTPTDPSNNVTTIMDFAAFYSTPEFTDECFKSTVWGTYGYDGWGIWDENQDHNPNNVDADGRRDIRHVIYPLIDVYDVNDPSYQEYLSLILKASGIDVLSFRLDLRFLLSGNDRGDCEFSVRGINNYFSAIDKLGMPGIVRLSASTAFSQFGLDGHTDEQATAALEEMLAYLDQNVFSLPNYLYRDGLPVLYLSGGVEKEEDLDNFRVFDGRVHLISNSTPFFEGIEVSDKMLIGAKKGGQNSIESPTISRFANTQDGVQSADELVYDDGIYLKESLDEIKVLDPEYLYLDGWNLYSTFNTLNLFEPTREFGHSQLAILADFIGTGYTASELEVCTDYYIKRKALKNDAFAQLQLDQIKQYIISDQMDKAVELNAMIE